MSLPLLDDAPNWSVRSALTIAPGRWNMRNGHTAIVTHQKVLKYGDNGDKSFPIWVGRCIECDEGRTMSALEAVTNIVAGVMLQYVLGMSALHWLGFQITAVQNLQLTAVMTVASFLRQYIIRRAFV